METITTFKELLNEISYSWHYPERDLTRKPNGTFVLGKLTITKTQAEYKEEKWELAPGVYERLVLFHDLLNKNL